MGIGKIFFLGSLPEQTAFPKKAYTDKKKKNLKFSKISGKQTAKIERGCMQLTEQAKDAFITRSSTFRTQTKSLKNLQTKKQTTTNP